MVWMWKPAREVTICLKKTMAAPQEVRMDTIASIVSELESISVLKKGAKNGTEGFSHWKTCSFFSRLAFNKCLIRHQAPLVAVF